jgi:hypothetical protein
MFLYVYGCMCSEDSRNSLAVLRCVVPFQPLLVLLVLVLLALQVLAVNTDSNTYDLSIKQKVISCDNTRGLKSPSIPSLFDTLESMKNPNQQL